MTTVDFYVLDEGANRAAELLACKLAEKALTSGKQIYIQAADAEQALQLNELLWSFKADSFLPHQLATDGMESCPIIIGHLEAPEHCEQILINLSQKIPPGYARFERLLEVVPAEHEARQALRENYAHYRDRGYALQTHSISL